MKVIVIIILLIISQIGYSVCESYIPDEWPDSRYTIEIISGDNIVTDNKTGLVWQQCSHGLSGTDCMMGAANLYNWEEALEIADDQNLSGYAGYTDWRLPNIKELKSLAAFNCHSPSINTNVFPNTTPRVYYSSSPVDFAFGDEVMFFDFENGGLTTMFYRDADARIRLVRSGD